MTVQLDAEINRLLLERVASLEELVALLLLHQVPSRAMTTLEVADAAHLDLEGAAAALVHLQGRGLLRAEADASPPTYRYFPENARVAAVVDRLAQLYAERPVEVFRRMSANAIERLRLSAGRAFADAFVFKDKKDDR